MIFNILWFSPHSLTSVEKSSENEIEKVLRKEIIKSDGLMEEEEAMCNISMNNGKLSAFRNNFKASWLPIQCRVDGSICISIRSAFLSLGEDSITEWERKSQAKRKA